MRDSGLIDWWGRRMAGSERCVIEEIRPADSPRPIFSKLSMSNLQGPFAVLVCGFVLSIFSWIVEIVIASEASLICHFPAIHFPLVPYESFPAVYSLSNLFQTPPAVSCPGCFYRSGIFPNNML